VAHLEIDLLPAQWQSTARRHRDSRAWRKGAMIAAAVYLLIVAAAAVDLFVLHRRVAGLEADLNAQRPALSLLQSRQARFNSLAAAIDSHRYAVELLFLLNRCLPEQSVHFTEFDQMPQQWRIVGEAPTPGLATEYLLRLKHDPDLSGCDISADPPRLLADGRAQFQVVGKP
jgi:hypothetical protein